MNSDTGAGDVRRSLGPPAIVAPTATASAAPTPISHFNKLPVELLLEVMKNCPDFTTLWGLIQTKKHLTAVFNMEPVTIVECIMTRLYDADHPLNILMRHVVEIRLGNYAFSTWSALREITENAEIPLPFSSSLPPLLIHRFVQLAHKIHLLAHMIIQQGLWRFEEDFNAATCWHPDHRFDCGAGPEGFRVPQTSLLAEERAVVAFWRLQYFLELKAAANGNLLRLWSSGDQTRMRRLRVMDFYTEDHVRRQVAAAADLIDSMRREPWESHVVGLPPYSLPSMGEIASKLADCGGPVNMSELVCHPSPTNFHVPAVTMEPFAYRYLTMFCRAPDRWRSRIRHLPTHAYRKYGIFFWDHNMLLDSGLLPESLLALHSNKRLADECFLKWLRLLEVDPEAVERALLHAFNRA